MRLFCLLLLICTGLQGQEVPTDLSQTAKPQTIKVLLAKHHSSALLEVKGNYQVINSSDGLEIARGGSNKRYNIHTDARGLNWGEVFPGIYQIRIVPFDAFASILVDGIQYRGCIEICAVGEFLQIINEVDVESYLKSILTAQFPSGINDEVLQAIAVVARTNAYYTIARNAHAFWHVEAEEVGYLGYGVTLQNLRIDQAVDLTRQVILTYKDLPFAASWTKNSAGTTASFSSMFRKNTPSPDGVQAPLAAKARDKSRWTLSVPTERLAEVAGMPQVTEVTPFRDKSSSKVYALRFKCGERFEDISFIDLQKKLGEESLKSSDFTIVLKEGQVIFTGYGEGSGVGLCLYSATLMAKDGLKAKKILSEFFPGTKSCITEACAR